MTPCGTCYDKAHWVCRYVCMWVSLFSYYVFLRDLCYIFFLFPCPLLKARASNGLCFLLLFCTYKISYEEAVITADAAKNLESEFHTTHNGNGWEKGEQTYNPLVQTLWFSLLKKKVVIVLMSPNEGAAAWVKPHNSLLVTPSCWVSESFITGNLHTTLALLLSSPNRNCLDKCKCQWIIKFRTWFNSVAWHTVTLNNTLQNHQLEITQFQT